MKIEELLAFRRSRVNWGSKTYWKSEEYREYRKVYRKLDRLNHPKKNLAWDESNRNRHRPLLNERARRYHSRNRLACNARCRIYHQRNSERRREEMRQWRRINPDKRRANESLRRARKYNAVTGCQKRVARIYKRCVELRQWFDVQVDHIIPLALGGAHSATNLQIVYAFENLRKHDNPLYTPRVVFR